MVINCENVYLLFLSLVGVVCLAKSDWKSPLVEGLHNIGTPGEDISQSENSLNHDRNCLSSSVQRVENGSSGGRFGASGHRALSFHKSYGLPSSILSPSSSFRAAIIINCPVASYRRPPPSERLSPRPVLHTAVERYLSIIRIHGPP